MDPRRDALMEVRHLLASEGWAPAEIEEMPSPDGQSAIGKSRPNLILSVICFAAVITNLILIGANRDLMFSKRATIEVSGFRIEGLRDKGDPDFTIFHHNRW